MPSSENAVPPGVLGSKDIGLKRGKGGPLPFGKELLTALKKFPLNRKQSIITQNVMEEKQDGEREEEYEKTLDELPAAQEESESDPKNQRSTKRNEQIDVPSGDRPKNQASTKRKAELQMPFANQSSKKTKVTNFQGMIPI